MGMRCSVVIPCHNGADLTRRCIDSLLAQAGGHPDEILLVDNASTDETATLERLHHCVRVLPQADNRGFAAAVNVGIRSSGGELVLVLNNDTQAASNLLQELARVLTSSPWIGATAPVSNHVKGPARLPVGDRGKHVDGRRDLATALQDTAPLQDVDTLAGLCLLLRRSTFEQVGLFDERFGHGNFEDDDLSLRLRLHGYRLVVARRAFLHHEGHATFRALGMDIEAQIDQRRRQFIDKWRHDPAGRATIAALQGDLPAAAAAAANARHVWPLWPDADWHLARGYALDGDLAAAAQHLHAFVRACPHHGNANVALGRALLAIGDHDAACLQLASTARSCHLDAGQLAQVLGDLGEQDYRRGRLADATANFLAVQELQPDDATCRNWLGLCHLASGDLPAAERSFRAAADADFALAHTNLGICLHRLGRDDEAQRSFERAVQLLPHDATARNNLDAMRGASRARLVSSRDS
jgi:GT2 family glycosyltransferase